jgi:hypothetical protein
VAASVRLAANPSFTNGNRRRARTSGGEAAHHQIPAKADGHQRPS